jgi:hypothetical protein
MEEPAAGRTGRAPRAAALARRLRHVPAVLLLAVAALQIVLARHADLSPWSGGGFGMFSTTDVWARRHLHVFAIRPGLLSEVEIPDELREPARRALALPAEGRLRALARALAELPSPDQGPPDRVELQVFATRFDPQTLAPSGVPLRSLRVPIGPVGVGRAPGDAP